MCTAALTSLLNELIMERESPIECQPLGFEGTRFCLQATLKSLYEGAKPLAAIELAPTPAPAVVLSQRFDSPGGLFRSPAPRTSALKPGKGNQNRQRQPRALSL